MQIEQQLGSAPPIVRGNVTPPPGARYTGELHLGFQPVYAQKKRDWVRVPARDVDGNLLYHLNGDGTRRAPKWELVEGEEYEVEFVIDDLGNGITTKNFYFRADPAHEAKTAKENRRKEQFEKLLDAIDTSGIDVHDLVAVVQSVTSAKPNEPEALSPVPPPAEPDAVKRAPPVPPRRTVPKPDEV